MRNREALNVYFKTLIQVNREFPYRNPFKIIPAPEENNREIIVKAVEKVVKNREEAVKTVDEMTEEIKVHLEKGERVEIESGEEMIDFLPDKLPEK